MDQTGPVARPAATVRVVAAGCLAVACTSVVVALLAAGGAPPDLPSGIADPGPVVGWGTPVVRLAGLLAAALTVGSLLVAGVLGPQDPVSVARAVRSARRAAVAWTVTAVLGHVLVVCDTVGATLTTVPAGRLLPWSATGETTPTLATAALAALVAAASGASATRRRAAALVPLALAAALASPVAGHLASSDDGGLSLGGLVVHVAASLVWAGGLAGLVLHLRTDPGGLAVAVPRFSALALVAYTALAGSGLVAVSATLPLSGAGWQTAWVSGYAAVVAAKTVVLVALGVVGARHRRVTVPRVVAQEPGAFLRLAAAELLLMAAAAGLATALSRTPPPDPDPGVVVHEIATVDPLSLTSLLGAWRPDAVVLLVLGAGLAAYLTTRRRRSAEARDWPRHRTRCFVTGTAVAAVTLCSGIATYAPLLLSVHLAQQLVLLLVVPPLLLLGRPVDLARGAGARDLPAGVRHLLAVPLTGALATCVLLTVVHRTPVVSQSLGSSWWHLVVVALTLACGLALWWPVLAAEAPERRPSTEWAGWLLPVVACLAVLAIQLRGADDLLASAWFLELRLGWVDPVEDQRLAGTIAGLAALALAGVAVVTWVLAARSRPARPDATAPDQPRGQDPRSTLPVSASSSTAP
ncbi:cytochrome c oxidase assembly protein [Nocardioides sp. AX2bis]|uniref:cytochrome c oxidase assembly protein n=1 Tax=Nocardioides sp. AX2bis TaxID=2653157 RepID=UPI0012EF6578|nr:cytochrome c oxidase assembly protein [Nocardioides sp. AX2bis]VXB16223.1 Copper resistance protein D [Nocardioides sp. AX2bis]